MKNKNKQILAFTLIELLVVIVIIGILSGIGIVGFNSYKDKANTAKSEAECAQVLRCEQIKATCRNGDPNDVSCDILCDVEGLTCDIYPSKSQWTSATCFTSTPASFTGTISAYYAHESNNNSNPACPRDVVIPQEINNIEVQIIGNGSFKYKSLDSVIMPNSVSTIKSEAFRGNKLKLASIGKGVENIEWGAFYFNDITALFIPDNVTTIEHSVFWNNPLVGVDAVSLKFGTSIGASAFPSGCTVASGCITERP